MDRESFGRLGAVLLKKANPKKVLLLFVHGLGGSASSWGKFSDLIIDDTELRDEVEVQYYVYPTGLLQRWPFSRAVKIDDLCNSLHTKMEYDYASYDRVVLVCHSMGGLIARRYLTDVIKVGKHLRVSSLVCFATPHNGPELTDVVAFVNKNHEQISSMIIGSPFMEGLSRDWQQLRCGLKVPSVSVRGGQDFVVGSASSHGMLDSEPLTIADKDHISIVKPNSRADTAYLIVKRQIMAVLSGGNIQLRRAKNAFLEGDDHTLIQLVANYGRSWIESRDSGSARDFFEQIIQARKDTSEEYIWAKYLLSLTNLFRFNETSTTVFPDSLLENAKMFDLECLFIAERMEFARKRDELEPALVYARQVSSNLLLTDNTNKASIRYAKGTSLFLLGNLFRRGGRYHDASEFIERAKYEYKSTIASHQIELAHCHYAKAVCQAMAGKHLPVGESNLISAEFRLFADALLILTGSHREWLRGDAGEAIKQAEAAADAFAAISFGSYAKRAINLKEHLSIWQKLELGAKPNDIADDFPDHASTIRGLLGIPDALGTLKERFKSIRPSRAIGLLQIAAAYGSDRYQDDIGEFELPKVLVAENDWWRWQSATACTLAEADAQLRQLMGVAPNIDVPLVAD